MSSRGSALSRTIRYFRESDIEEAHYVYHRATEILKQRASETQPAQEKKQRKPRTRKVTILPGEGQATAAS